MPLLRWLRRRRRARLRAQPFPAPWCEALSRNVALYRVLPPDDQRELEGHVQVLLAEKSFEGCGGLTLTDEITVTIAGCAALLLLHRDTDYYPGLRSILVYPSTYFAPAQTHLGGGVVLEGTQARLGESWHRGAVVLAWDDVLRGAADMHDGRNVVLHELAHQLDQQDGWADGAPELPHRAMYRPWARVLSREFEAHTRAVDAGRPTLIDPYGALNPAEFFAVVTEAFFEKPKQLRARHPDLYEQLQAFYRQDPAALRDAVDRADPA